MGELCPSDCSPAQTPLELSYFHGVSTTPLCGQTLGQVLEEAVRAKPSHVAYKFPEFNQSLSFKQLSEKATSLAEGFLALGLRSGEIVMGVDVCDENFVVIFVACSFIGLAFVNPSSFSPYDVYLKSVLLKVAPSLLILHTDRSDRVDKFLAELMDTDADGFQRPNTLKNIAVVERVHYESLQTLDDIAKLGKRTEKERLGKAKKIVSNEDCVYIVTTSGSTGDVKFVCLSHYALVNYGLFCVSRRAQGKREIMGYINPVEDDTPGVFGIVEMLCHWKEESVGIYMPRTVDHSENGTVAFMKFVEDYRISRPGAPPYLILSMIHSPLLAKYDTSSMTGVTVVAQAITQDTRRRLLEVFPDLCIGYGQCEHIGIAFTPPGIPGKQRTEVVGYPCSHHEVKVVGAFGETLPVGRAGEIWVRGPCRFLGYLRDEESTREVLDRNGWVHSGDIGSMDAEGYLTLLGRKADVIRFKHLGYVVYPNNIEKTVLTFSKVKDAKVVGVPLDEEKGDSICLCVVAKPGMVLEEEELRNFCKQKLLDRDLPQHYFVMESFPLTGARQKVSRQKLKEHIQKTLWKSQD